MYEALRERLFAGGVIPASPLALGADGAFDERHQRAIFRYYRAAGAAGLAVGVHTTQFAIHDEAVGLYRPLLELAGEVLGEGPGLPLRVAGLVGRTENAVREAEIALGMGYDCGLLSLAAFQEAGEAEILEHCRAVSEAIPLMGFYLQPAVGGRVLGYRFWRQFVEIPNVVAIKIAPFNRYYTLDVLRALWDAGRADDIDLYTGNDDAIVADLVTAFRFDGDADRPPLRFVGGLLGHWAVWTKRAVDLVERCRAEREAGSVSADLLTLGAQVTDSNAAFFDTPNAFAGCIVGLHEVMVRQGLMASRRTLDPDEDLSPGQMDEIDRVYAAYPHLNDDAFVREHLDEWLR
ncbi:MAG: dihydrodipicolinate synthase family protein [Chloroflexi bacterium]|nr:dihydrodipicolinate synthase family protein [Chloroflexota bacterium]